MSVEADTGTLSGDREIVTFKGNVHARRDALPADAPSSDGLRGPVTLTADTLKVAEGAMAEGLLLTANRDRLAMIDRPSPSQPVSPLPAGHLIAMVRLDVASSRRRRTTL
jgi:hypothetical protein